MNFECSVKFAVTPLKGEEDLQLTVKGPKEVEILLKDTRVYNVLAMRKQLVAALNQKLDELTEKHLKQMAIKEDARESGLEDLPKVN